MVDVATPFDTTPPADIPFEAVANAWQSLAPFGWDWRMTPRVKGKVSTGALQTRRNPYEGVIVEFRPVKLVIRTGGENIDATAVVGCGFIVAIDASDKLARLYVQRFVGEKQPQ